MMTSIRAALAAAIALTFASSAMAAISGPTQSNGQFTLNWTEVNTDPNDGVTAYLLDVSTGQQYNTSPVSFDKQNGVYEFRERLCLELWSSITCHTIDTHTVTVSGATPPPPGPAHVLKRGDIDGNGLLDYAVIAPVAANREVDDFILLNTGGGNLSVIVSPTSAQMNAARAWTTIQAGLSIVDLNGDTKLDVTVFNVSGIDDFVVWSSDTQPHNYPTRTLRVNADVTVFMSEMAASLTNPNYYANPTTTFVIPVSDWYVVTGFLEVGGFFYDENGVWRYFPPGLATILVWYTAGEVVEVIDDTVVISYPAYVLKEVLDSIADDTTGSVIDAVAQILIILEDVFNTDIGVPEVRGPYPNDDDARGGLGVALQVLSEFCDNLPYVCNAPGESGKGIGAITICAAQLSPSELWKIADPGSYVMPKVAASAGFDHRITTTQRTTSETSTDTARRSFWQSRWNDSKDPAAPLALDIVDDEYALGCIANRRYESFRDRFGGSASLTAIGSEIMREHRDKTDEDFALSLSVPAKLGPRQLADYHHDVFGDENLPARTFGATPITGDRDEAKIYAPVFCPSCDDD